MREACPVCGLHLERGEHGYIVGAYMFNIVGAELIFAAIFLGVSSTARTLTLAKGDRRRRIERTWHSSEGCPATRGTLLARA